MGLFDLLGMATKALTALEALGDLADGDSSGSEDSGTSGIFHQIDRDTAEAMLDLCEDYIGKIDALTIDDVDELLEILPKIDRRLQKLGDSEIYFDDEEIKHRVDALDPKREAAVDAFQQKLDAHLEQLQQESSGLTVEEKDRFIALNDEWYRYFHEKNRIMDYEISKLEQLASDAESFLG